MNQRRLRSKGEWPTWLLAAVIYFLWALVVAFHRELPLPILALLGGLTVAWHLSLQHEATHGHPTRIPWVNTLIVGAPLALYLPFPIYRESHLAHHRTRELSHPLEDSESFYVTEEQWARLGPVARGVLTVCQTLLGRIVLGPIHALVLFFQSEVRLFRIDTPRRVPIWVFHLFAVLLLVVGLEVFAGMPAWKYILCFAYPGLGITLVRSFHEHRPHPAWKGRSAMLEAGPFFRLLFLNNNLHALHHREPDVPWYELPRVYRQRRHELLGDIHDFHLPGGYAAMFRRYFVRPKDSPVYPSSL
ncbi:MAG: fatty acid desaturase [Myxococcales bacterium]|nr:fatty acid desaturase [Myxococcales bacterium]